MRKLLPSVTYTGRNGLTRWRMVGASGRWRASVWCDCEHGLHFHNLGRFHTAREAHAAIAAIAAIDRRTVEKVKT